MRPTMRNGFFILWMVLGWTTTAMAQDDIADVPGELRHVVGQDRMSYILIGAADNAPPPEDGYRLLVMLPGGDGGEGFTPFMKRIYQYAIPDPENYLVAQLIAVKWSDDQPIVWPTRGDGVPGAEFTTESFISAVVDQIGKDHPIDLKHVYSLSWSSGGPAAYAASLTPDAPIKGSFIAMSVFKPDRMPPLDHAAGRAYYLLQSPQDKITPIRFARQALAELTDHGAQVHLAEYEGGHGWRGDVYDMIRDGIDWLEAKSGGQSDQE